MATRNKTRKPQLFAEVRLAGGMGQLAARQDAEGMLRRSVMACLLWEDNAYIDGESIAQNICDLIPQVKPEIVAAIAVEARFVQKLRHVPLLVVREMARYSTHSHLVAETLAKVIHRPDEMTEFLSIYWLNNGGKKTLTAQVKRGLATAFAKFNEYQLAKYNRKDKDVKLVDVLRLSHAKAQDETQNSLWQRLIQDKLATPDTWEVALSAGKDKKATWERLITENKLGSFAFLKNLRNMQQAGVTPQVIRDGLSTMKVDLMLPIDFLKAVKFAPDYSRELENAMFRCAGAWKKLPGKTVLVVDVSGSMGAAMSAKSDFNRMAAAAAIAVIASEVSDSVSIYATAGRHSHMTEKMKPYRGFALSDAILGSASRLGGGGIFTRQCLEYIKTQEQEQPDRIIVFSDSQDCDSTDRIPKPFGKKNYIVDVASHKNGVNYKGIWTAEIAGWSEGFLSFIANSENVVQG